MLPPRVMLQNFGAAYCKRHACRTISNVGAGRLYRHAHRLFRRWVRNAARIARAEVVAADRAEAAAVMLDWYSAAIVRRVLKHGIRTWRRYVKRYNRRYLRLGKIAAAVQIQRVFRSMVARELAAMERFYFRLHKAARIVQRCFRVNWIQRRNDAAIVITRNLVRWEQRKYAALLLQATVRAQLLVRRRIAIVRRFARRFRIYVAEHKRRHASASRIASCFRGIKPRRHFGNARRAANRIRGLFKRHVKQSSCET